MAPCLGTTFLDVQGPHREKLRQLTDLNGLISMVDATTLVVVSLSCLQNRRPRSWWEASSQPRGFFALEMYGGGKPLQLSLAAPRALQSRIAIPQFMDSSRLSPSKNIHRGCTPDLLRLLQLSLIWPYGTSSSASSSVFTVIACMKSSFTCQLASTFIFPCLNLVDDKSFRIS